MPASVLISHFQFQPYPGLSLDEHLRQGATRRPKSGIFGVLLLLAIGTSKGSFCQGLP